MSLNNGTAASNGTAANRRAPLIGLSMRRDFENNRFALGQNYSRAVARAGGIPLLLPPILAFEQIAALLESLDALVLSGGEDVNPVLFGQTPHPKLGRVDTTRDEFELELCRQWLQTGKPLLGICRGVQLLNIAAGGTLYQDIPSEQPEAMRHAQNSPRCDPAHFVEIEPHSTLSRFLGGGECASRHRILVNSIHHQSVKDAAAGFQVCATASDGIIEAIEAADGRPVLGAQWHPEDMAEMHPVQLQLFEAFVAAASTPAINRDPVRCVACESELLVAAQYPLPALAPLA